MVSIDLSPDSIALHYFHFIKLKTHIYLYRKCSSIDVPDAQVLSIANVKHTRRDSKTAKRREIKRPKEGWNEGKRKRKANTVVIKTAFSFFNSICFEYKTNNNNNNNCNASDIISFVIYYEFDCVCAEFVNHNYVHIMLAFAHKIFLSRLSFVFKLFRSCFITPRCTYIIWMVSWEAQARMRWRKAKKEKKHSEWKKERLKKATQAKRMSETNVNVVVDVVVRQLLLLWYSKTLYGNDSVFSR